MRGPRESDLVLTEQRDHVLVITINRPEVRNAFDLATADAMSKAVDLLDEDPELRVGVLTGAGGHFSSGMDRKASLTGDVPYVARRGIFGIINEPPTKPLVGAAELTLTGAKIDADPRLRRRQGDLTRSSNTRASICTGSTTARTCSETPGA